MNLNNQPTVNELARLFAAQKDTLDSHILWINDAGEVRIDRLTPYSAETEFEQDRPTMRARLKMYRRGQGYVGKKAAADQNFMACVLQTLNNAWQQAKNQPRLHVVDSFS